MFPKKNRFTFKQNLPKKIFNSNSFSLRFGANDLGKLQVAVVVSKNVDKRATARNKIKRKILEIVRKQIKTDMPINLVFYVKKQALENQSLENEIKEAIKTIVNRS